MTGARSVWATVHTVTPQLEFSTDHGIYIRDWPAVPRVGDYVRLENEGESHDPDTAERVVYVLWADGGITIECKCEPVP